MTALNNVLAILTGPRRLRSALRLKTVAITSLLVALDGPAELRVRIPAAVFGGDIFGVMSSQLREALIVPPQSQVSPARPERRRLNELSASSAFNNFQHPFSSISELPNSPPQWSSSKPEVAAIASSAKSERLTEQRSVPQFSPLEQGISQKVIEASLGSPKSSVSVKPAANQLTFSTTNSLPLLTPTLVSSLNRYWQTVREERNTRAHQQHSTESAANTVDFPVAGSEQRTAPPSWPAAVSRDVSAKLRSFTGAPSPLQKSTRLSSAPERQIQNVFNIEVNQANHQSSGYDDLGDRLAQILHEQALQHGIDVT